MKTLSHLTSLGLPEPKPAPVPRPRRQVETLTHRQGQRLLFNQVLITTLESNTRKLIEENLWPNREDKLVGAVHHRLNELYDRYYDRNKTEEAMWLLDVVKLIEAAAGSVLSLAVEGNAIKTHRLGELLTQLAQLAGTYQDDTASNAA